MNTIHAAVSKNAPLATAHNQGPAPSVIGVPRERQASVLPTPPAYTTATAAATSDASHRCHQASTTAVVTTSGTSGHQRTSTDTGPSGAMPSRSSRPSSS